MLGQDLDHLLEIKELPIILTFQRKTAATDSSEIEGLNLKGSMAGENNDDFELESLGSMAGGGTTEENNIIVTGNMASGDLAEEMKGETSVSVDSTLEDLGSFTIKSETC